MTRRRTLKRMAIVVAALALASELWLQLDDWRPRANLLESDSRIGRKLAANNDGSLLATSDLLTDEHGLRRGPDPEPQGAPTVLFLGGSHVLGFGLPWRDTLGAQFQSLSEELGQPLRVVNAATPMGNSSNGRAFLNELGSSYRASLIVVSYGMNEVATVTSPHQCYTSEGLRYHNQHEQTVTTIDNTHFELLPEPTVKLPAFVAYQYQSLRWYVLSALGPGLKSVVRSRPPFAWMYRLNPTKYQQRMHLERSGADHSLEVYAANLRAMVGWAREHDVPIVMFVQASRGQQDFYQLLPENVRQLTDQALSDWLAQPSATSITRLEELVAMAPEYVMPRYNLAVALLEAGRRQEAMRVMQPVQRIRTISHSLLLTEVAASLGTPVVHAELAFEPQRDRDLIMLDGMHPTRAGNGVIAKLLLDKTTKLGLWPPAATATADEH